MQRSGRWRSIRERPIRSQDGGHQLTKVYLGKSGRAAAAAIGCYLIIVVVAKWLAPDVGWAASDARDAHFPAINYFIAYGFDLGYPGGFAMFPGMHAFTAFWARIFGIESLAFNGFPAFAIQSISGLLFLFSIWRLAALVAKEPADAVIGVVVILSSSYWLYAWVWPTTELGGYICYAFMMVLLLSADRDRWQTGAAFSVLGVVSVLWRQSSAPLAAALLLNSLSERFFGGQPLSVRKLVIGTVPIVAALAVLAMIAHLWGGLVPPGYQKHESNGVNFVQVAHMAALTGLVAWPFAVPAFRLVDDRRASLMIASFAVAVALVCWLLLPLDFNRTDGRWGSLIWTLVAHLHGPLSFVFLVATMSVGFSIWIGTVAVCWRERRIAPEIILFALFAAAFLVQAFSWQRYVEVQILITLAVFFIRRGPLPHGEAALIVAWFGAYGLLNLAKVIYGLSAG